jgi:hypothetical protein
MPEPAQTDVVCERLHSPKSSWRILVHEGKVLRCPWCKINARFINQDYFHGLQSFLAHARKQHRNVGVTQQKILSCAVELTKEQDNAFNGEADLTIRGESLHGRSLALLLA